jgi:hypothetical protein
MWINEQIFKIKRCLLGKVTIFESRPGIREKSGFFVVNPLFGHQENNGRPFSLVAKVFFNAGWPTWSLCSNLVTFFNLGH